MGKECPGDRFFRCKKKERTHLPQRRGEPLSPWELPESPAGPPRGEGPFLWVLAIWTGTCRAAWGEVQWLLVASARLFGDTCVQVRPQTSGAQRAQASGEGGLSTRTSLKELTGGTRPDSCGLPVISYFKRTTEFTLKVLSCSGLRTHTANVLAPLRRC